MPPPRPPPRPPEHIQAQTKRWGRAAAARHAEAARAWAVVARDVTRDIQGSDSPAFELWAAALEADGGLRPHRPQASQGVLNSKIEDLNDAIDRVSAQIEETSAEEMPLPSEG